ncbi:MAG: hypothetical protein JXA04_12160 [Gammaproteobacteria bacterium]|nr:hypothetical protein [Gammaproteobacteria bacterium]
MSNQIKNRRSGMDRRRHFIAPKFPFYDDNGNLVSNDRRNLPDRRLEGITVEWINDEEIGAVFPTQS